MKLIIILTVLNLSCKVCSSYKLIESNFISKTFDNLSEENRSTIQINMCEDSLGNLNLSAEWFVPEILQDTISTQINSSELYPFVFGLENIDINRICSNNGFRTYAVQLTNNSNLKDSGVNVDEIMQNIRWTSNGEIVMANKQLISPENYCIKSITDIYISVQTCEPSRIYQQIAFGANIAGALIILTVVIAHLSMWKTLNLHSKTVFMFSLISFIRLIVIALIYVFEDFRKDPPNKTIELCVVKGLLHNFDEFCTMTWMAILNFNVWTTMRSRTPTSQEFNSNKRFATYCFVGFGYPAFSVLIFYLTRLNSSEFGKGLDSSNLPDFLCSLDLSVHAVVSLNLPLLISLILACLTIKCLYFMRKETNLKDANSTLCRNQTTIVLKLFFLMGIFLVIQIGAWRLFNVIIPITWYSIIDDIMIIIYNSSIFYIIVWNEKFRRQLSKEYAILGRAFNYIDSHTISTSSNV